MHMHNLRLAIVVLQQLPMFADLSGNYMTSTLIVPYIVHLYSSRIELFVSCLFLAQNMRLDILYLILQVFFKWLSHITYNQTLRYPGLMKVQSDRPPSPYMVMIYYYFRLTAHIRTHAGRDTHTLYSSCTVIDYLAVRSSSIIPKEFPSVS